MIFKRHNKECKILYIITFKQEKHVITLLRLYRNDCKYLYRQVLTNSADPDETAS